MKTIYNVKNIFKSNDNNEIKKQVNQKLINIIFKLENCRFLNN